MKQNNSIVASFYCMEIIITCEMKPKCVESPDDNNITIMLQCNYFISVI